MNKFLKTSLFLILIIVYKALSGASLYSTNSLKNQYDPYETKIKNIDRSFHIELELNRVNNFTANIQHLQNHWYSNVPKERLAPEMGSSKGYNASIYFVSDKTKIRDIFFRLGIQYTKVDDLQFKLLYRGWESVESDWIYNVRYDTYHLATGIDLHSEIFRNFYLSFLGTLRLNSNFKSNVKRYSYYTETTSKVYNNLVENNQPLSLQISAKYLIGRLNLNFTFFPHCYMLKDVQGEPAINKGTIAKISFCNIRFGLSYCL